MNDTAEAARDVRHAGAPWGATPEDWAAWRALGLTADLLPVVSNPNAVISPMSKMKDLGKTPSRYGPDDLVVGLPKWTQAQSTARDVQRWSANSDLGICVQTRRMRAIDIDIADPVRAAEIEELISYMADLPVRFRENSGKCLMLFDMPGDFSKRVIKTAHGIIEFLATGQQFVAVGTHPSGARYEWRGGLPGTVPGLSPAEFEVLWQALVDQFALPGGSSEARRGMLPTAPRAAGDMQDPIVSWLDENGWVTGYERDGRVDVRCPWADGHSVDTGATSTSYFPAGVGGFESGHFHCLHASCSARTDADFLAATGHTRSAFDVVTALAGAKEVDPLPAFTRARNGQVEATINNLLMALRRADVADARIAFDTFLGTEVIGIPGRVWRPFTDNDNGRLQAKLEEGGSAFKPINPKLLRTAMLLVAEENKFDSAIEWARGLPAWDAVPRVDRFFATHMGADDTPYTQAVARYLWSALAGRLLVPGVKADMMPTLVGEQGSVKTSALEAMAPSRETFVEIDLSKKDDDIARLMGGKLVAEIAELRGLRSRDAESIKAWISRRVEEWVPKYMERPRPFARRCILIGTTNAEGFLDDATGERRHLPVRVGNADRDAIERDRDQLWAEGMALFEANGNEVLWRDAYELAKPEHAQFKAADPWTELVEEWLARDAMEDSSGMPRGAAPVRTADILSSCLGFERRAVSRRDEMRLAKVMQGLGFSKSQQRICGIVQRTWVRDAT
jgi:predicted P-loop ATPase